MKPDRSCVLCATDFSPHARDAAAVAAKLAQRAAQKLFLVHATDVVRPGAESLLRGRLAAEAQKLKDSGAEVEPVLLRSAGRAQALLSFIREEKPALVVVGCGVKGPVDRWAAGSFSELIAESSPAPTLIVRNSAAFETWDWMKARLTVLLALDLNRSSDVVLRWARQLQGMGPCDFVACHVNFRLPTAEEAAVPGVPLVNPAPLQQRLERELRRKVRDQIDDDSVELLVRANFGDPGPAIVDLAAARKVQVIAIGAHQRRGIHRLGQFSVSRDVLHQAAVNVVCVPVTARFDARQAHIPEFRRVLVVSDFSELGDTAVPYACGACAIGGLVRIAHVASPRTAQRNAGTGWSAGLRARLRALIPDETGARCQPPEVEVLLGRDVAATICAEAERFGADLVCMASHGLGASRALHGSVTKAVLKQIRRPLLVIRRPE